MKKSNKIIILISFCLILYGCNIGNRTKSNKNFYDIDDIYTKITEANFSNVKLVELDYDKINQTTIIIGDQGFGNRDLLVDNKGLSTQRILCYSMDDGTQINVILGYISIDGSSDKDMLISYTDSLKSIGQSSSNTSRFPIHVDSSVYLLENILINILSVNSERELDTLSIIKFNEEFIRFIDTEIS